MKPKVFFLEVLIVVIGVSLAFFAENKRQNYLNKKTENYYAKGIISDLEYNLSEIEYHFQGDSIQCLQSIQMRAELQNNEFTLDSLATAIMHFLYSRKMTFYQTTYQEMLGRGDLNLIQNDSLRRLLIDYFVYYDGVRYAEVHNSNMVTQLGIPYVNTNIDLNNIHNYNSQINQEAISEPEFYNMMLMFYGFTLDKLDIYHSFREKNIKILNALKENYH